jgi:aspartate aminotransferase-like enzyme
MRRRLATPGPTEVPQRLLLAGARETIHHRSADMQRLMAQINAELPALFATEQDVYITTSSGTGAMEAAVVNCFSPGDEVLVVSNGYFGERFEALCDAFGVLAHPIRSPWGTSVDVDEVAAAWEAHPAVRGVLVVQSETSAGTLNDVEAVAALFRDSDVLVVVDAISGLISHRLLMDEWGLDVVLAASHKGFMLPPGLAFIALSERAWPRVEQSRNPSFYWSFQRLRKFFPLSSTSPAVSLLLGLQEALVMIGEEGLEAIQRRQALVADATAQGLRRLGFELVVEAPHRRGRVVTAAYTPEGIAPKDLLRTLSEDYAITMTGGQGVFAGKIVRLGHVGAVDALELCSVFAGLELALSRMGHEFEAGAGVGAVVDVAAEHEVMSR